MLQIKFLCHVGVLNAKSKILLTWETTEIDSAAGSSQVIPGLVSRITILGTKEILGCAQRCLQLDMYLPVGPDRLQPEQDSMLLSGKCKRDLSQTPGLGLRV